MTHTLPRSALEDLVKASQRDAVLGPRWRDHVAAAGAKHADPARVPAALLHSFAEALAAERRGARLVAAVAEPDAQPSAKPPAARAPAPGAADAAAVDALVRATAAHPRYAEYYVRPPTADAGWVRPESVGVAAADDDAQALTGTHPPPLLALDCEMVETDASTSELVRVAVVAVRWRSEAAAAEEGDGTSLDPSTAVAAAAGAAAIDTVLSAAVRPKAAITNYRASITGLGPGALAAAPFARRGAAKAVAAALDAAAAAAAALGAPPPVLVGHALHHDINALRLCLGRRARVIDTALCFGWAGLPRAAPSLADLHAAIVGGPPLREAGAAHCCEKDAAAAALLALAGAAAGAVPLLAGAAVCAATGRRLLPPPRVQLTRDELSRLLVHSMPAGLTPVDAVCALQAVAPAAPAPVSTADAGGPSKTLLVFGTPGDADAAFAALVQAAGGKGAVSTDSLGRQQVAVALGTGATVRVRRAGAHGGMSHGVDRTAVKKRDRTAAEVAVGRRKRLKGGGGGG